MPVRRTAAVDRPVQGRAWSWQPGRTALYCDMVRRRDEILRVLAENRDRIREFGVRTLALFGSAARNEATETSDLDFVVEFDRKTFDNYMGLKELLEELFGCPVDLVIRSAVKRRLREPILSSAVHAPGL